ncbi:hypothetical protein QL093DRAFT_2225921 [Fusarium oxysporum]|nr:hypothetical protein QL093DRAFT_2225921 [Fusarium oxysporum]
MRIVLCNTCCCSLSLDFTMAIMLDSDIEIRSLMQNYIPIYNDNKTRFPEKSWYSLKYKGSGRSDLIGHKQLIRETDSHPPYVQDA